MEFVSNLVSSSYSTVSSNKLATAGSVAGLYYMYRRWVEYSSDCLLSWQFCLRCRYMQYYEEEMQKFYVKQKYFKESQETSDKTVEG